MGPGGKHQEVISAYTLNACRFREDTNNPAACFRNNGPSLVSVRDCIQVLPFKETGCRLLGYRYSSLAQDRVFSDHPGSFPAVYLGPFLLKI